MCKIFNDFQNDIKKYCVENNLNADKVFKSAKSFNDNTVFLQHYDREKGNRGLLDETPAPVTLKMYLTGGILKIEQTEITKKYLS